MNEESTRIETIFRCADCKNWFTAKTVSFDTRCPECNGPVDHIAASTLLDIAILFKPDEAVIDDA
jgi:Zn finger protein HypA/HybF involved in hydrogenase expression